MGTREINRKVKRVKKLPGQYRTGAGKRMMPLFADLGFQFRLLGSPVGNERNQPKPGGKQGEQEDQENKQAAFCSGFVKKRLAEQVFVTKSDLKRGRKPGVRHLQILKPVLKNSGTIVQKPDRLDIAGQPVAGFTLPLH